MIIGYGVEYRQPMKKSMITVACVGLLGVWWGTFTHAEMGVRALFEQGRSHIEAGDYSRAVEAFSKVLELLPADSPDTGTALLARADAYVQEGKLREAWNDVQTVLASKPVDGETVVAALHVRGLINLKRGRPREAAEDFTTAIKTHHKAPELRAISFSNRGIAFVKEGRFDKAISDLNKAIQLDPNCAFSYARRGLAYLRADKIAMAQRDVKRALRMNPDDRTRKLAALITKEVSISASGPRTVTLPLNKHGQIFVQVRFSKRGAPHTFLLDTGATFSLVSQKLLKQIRRETEVTKVGKDMVSIADGSKHIVTRYRVKTAFVYNLPLGAIEVHVFDEKRNLVNLLGTRSIGNIAVSIDNAARKVKISRKSVAEQ